MLITYSSSKNLLNILRFFRFLRFLDEIPGEDSFVPTISACPSLYRRMAAYDDILLSEQVLQGEGVAPEVESSLIDSLDGFQLGCREFLSKHLGPTECALVWHVPVVGTQPVNLLLLWKEVEDDCYPEPDDKTTFRRHKAAPSPKNGKKLPQKQHHTRDITGTGTIDVIMEFAKSDADSMTIKTAIKKFLDGMHSRPNSRRVSASQEAIAELSEALALTEILSMIPPHITSLTICCPPILRLIPW